MSQFLLQRKVQFALPSWYPKLRRLTIKSIMLPLPENFLDYLESDGVFLPESCGKEDEGDWSSDDDVDADYAAADSGESARAGWHFEEFEAQVKTAIQDLGGKVFPKLNWSSPRDAAWINANSVVCRNVRDVFLLLKSSTNVAIDVQILRKIKEVGIESEEVDAMVPTLVLREWRALSPSGHFRCFVSDGILFAASQRDKTEFFPSARERRERVGETLREWFETNVREVFRHDQYVIDVVVAESGERVTLLDFDTYEESTDPILFSWSEIYALQAQKSDNVVVRVVEESSGVQLSASLLNGLPADLVGQTDADVDSIVDTLRGHIKRQESAPLAEE